MGYQKITLIILAAAVIAAAVWYMNTRYGTTMRVQELSIAGNRLEVEVAESQQEQRRGLSGRNALRHDRGMLFVYPEKAIRNFWMKDMRFGLDVLWIADGAVVGTQERIPYATDADGVVRFHSNAPADMVLEVNAGWIAEHNIRAGDAVIRGG